MTDIELIAETCTYMYCEECPFYVAYTQVCLLEGIPQRWNVKKIGEIVLNEKELQKAETDQCSRG